MELTQYQVVILCGGQGTRIRAVAEDRPKPMVDIGDRPILWHVMKIYAHFGFRRFILALGHQGDRIVDYFEHYFTRHHDCTLRFDAGRSVIRACGCDRESDVGDWEITLAHTGLNTMTGGRIRRVREYIDKPHFFCTYGDGVSDVDVRQVFVQHLAESNIATLVGVHCPTTFGVIEPDDAGKILQFREKPILPGFINGGFFCFSQDLFGYLEEDATVLESDSLQRIAKQGALGMFRHSGFWHAMDHYKDYVALNDLWARGTAPWKIW